MVRKERALTANLSVAGVGWIAGKFGDVFKLRVCAYTPGRREILRFAQNDRLKVGSTEG